MMREICVHLDQEVRAAGERVGESLAVGLAEALLAGAVKHLDPVELGRQAVRDRSGPVGRVVIND
jgi:hypothetical protein